MFSLRMEILDEKAGRPFGNPFKVKAITEEEIGPTILDIGTGITLVLPTEMKLDVSLVRYDIVFLSYRFSPEGELRLIVQHDGSLIGDEILATVYVVERKIVPVRFVEVKDGKRMVSGTPMEATPE